MCNKQLPRRSLAELDTVIEEIIQRNPKEYQELLDLIQEKMRPGSLIMDGRRMLIAKYDELARAGYKIIAVGSPAMNNK